MAFQTKTLIQAQSLFAFLILLALGTANADYYFRRPTTPSPPPRRYAVHKSPPPRRYAVHKPPPPRRYVTPKLPPLRLPAVAPNGLAAGFMGVQNAARLRLGERPLVWDAKLERYAKWWAEQRRYDCALVHSNGPYGENIFWGSGSGWTPAQAAQSWAVEGKFYNYNSDSCSGGQMCGHYTQIVWKGTQRIGCARVVCANDAGVFMTCNYDPPGNYMGEKPY